MIVAKFGGTSIEDSVAIKRVSSIITNLHNNEKKLVLVFSAAGKTTKKLLNCFTAAKNQNYKEAMAIYGEIKNGHQKLAQFKKLDMLLESLKHEIESLCSQGPKQLLLKEQDRIIAYGELISSTIMEKILNDQKIPSILIDARSMIKTDENFSNASVLFEKTNPQIKEAVKKIIDSERVFITQGFLGSTLNGETTTLGLEGSDYTAAIIGSAISANEIQLWKTVPGIMTADPTIVKEASVIRTITHAEMETLSNLGAKCIHPKAMGPIKAQDIPIRILNSSNANDVGTLITSNSKIPIRSITYQESKDGYQVSVVGEKKEYQIKKDELDFFLIKLHREIFL